MTGHRNGTGVSASNKSENHLWQDAVRRLVAWFRAEGRPLAFRRERTPYSTWILEVMGQQTQLSRAALYLDRWLEAFPTSRARGRVREVV
jgi:A/G-specific adenine glycosylase